MRINSENITDVNIQSGYLLKFTRTFCDWYPRNKYMAEAACLREMVPLFFQETQKNDLFTGRAEYPPIGFSPQVYTKRSGFGYYCEPEKIQSLLESPKLDREAAGELRESLDFWKSYDSVNQTRALYPEWVNNILPEDDWIGTPGIAFPLYRMGGSQLDYDLLLSMGIDGMKDKIRRLNADAESPESQSFYEALLYSLDTFTMICDAYIEHLESKDPDGIKISRKELMISSLKRIRKAKPEHLHEAIQLLFLFNVLSGSQNYGRMDEYLGDFYARDLESGYIQEQTAKEYLKSLWFLMEARGTIYDGRVIIGGRGRRNSASANRLALLIMEVAAEVKTILPQLSLRFDQDQDPLLYKKALDTLASGYVYPMLYNDEVNLPSVSEAFGVDTETAETYTPFGCGEYTLYHQSFDSPNGIINLARALECLLHGGSDPQSGEKCGINPRLESIRSFEELLSLYKEQVEHHIRALAYTQKTGYDAAGDTTPFLYMSMLYDDCLERGKPLLAGGVKYLGGSVETYGNTNVADSLYALRKVCFDEKRFSLSDIGKMLKADFAGYEKERQILLSLSKYGNDHDGPDSIYTELHDHVCNFTRSLAQENGLHHYLVVIINNDANTDLGFLTGALPDGRRKGEGLNNGNSPVPGRDQSGITAFMNSILKPSTRIHGGAVQNIKFSKEMFGKYREKTENLLYAYFDSGGAQAMITVVGREDLENALRKPDEYRNLVVRVGGFSARFVELRSEVQMEIIQRTLY